MKRISGNREKYIIFLAFIYYQPKQQKKQNANKWEKEKLINHQRWKDIDCLNKFSSSNIINYHFIIYFSLIVIYKNNKMRRNDEMKLAFWKKKKSSVA